MVNVIYAVKALTKNIKIVHALNKFGHGVPYNQLEENDTAFVYTRLQWTSTKELFYQSL